MNRSKYLIKNVGLLTISNFSSKILVFLLVPIYTSVLSTSEYGIYDLIVSIVVLLYPILTLNIVDALMRFIMDDTYSKKIVISLGLKYIIFSIFSIIVINCGLYVLKIWNGQLIFFLLYYISYALNQFFIQLAKGLEKVQDMAIAGVISTLATLIFNILFLLVFKWKLNGFFIANILSQVISVIYLFLRIRLLQYIDFSKSEKKIEKEMLLYCTPLIATTLGWWANNTLDKYAVTLLCGVSANGLLAVSYKIPSILNTVQSIFIQAWQISAIKEYGEKDSKKFYGSTFSTINLIMCGVCAGLILLTRPLATILYVNNFYVAWKFVPFLLISSVLNCAAGLLGPILSAKKDTQIMMWSAIIGAAINLVLNLGLIPLIGTQGATIATVASSLVIYVVRRYGVGKDIIITDKYYWLWILLMAQAIIEVTIGNRIAELGLCVLMILVNRKSVVNVLSMAKNIVKI